LICLRRRLRRHASPRIKIGPIEVFESEPDWRITPVVDIMSGFTRAEG
jgi:hypothetical protein